VPKAVIPTAYINLEPLYLNIYVEGKSATCKCMRVMVTCVRVMVTGESDGYLCESDGNLCESDGNR